MRVILESDFIRGKHLTTGKLRALDGDHLPTVDAGSPPNPSWLQPGDKRSSGDGVEGGDFRELVQRRGQG